MPSAKEELINNIGVILMPAMNNAKYSTTMAEIKLKLSEFDIQKEEKNDNTPNYIYVAKFLESKRIEGKSEKTIEQYRFQISKMIEKINKPISSITTDDLRDYLSIRRDNGNSNRTISNMKSYLSSFFIWATNNDVISKNPMTLIQNIKYKKEIKKPISQDDLCLIKDECNSKHGKRDRAIVEFLFAVGCRVEELCALNIQDVDFQTLEVHITKAKGDKERIAHISSSAAMYLKKYLESRNDNNQALFLNALGGSRSDRISDDGVRYLLHKLQDSAGITSNVHPHKFRRTCATHLLRSGMGIETVAHVLGHSNINTTKIYTYLDDSDVATQYHKIMR